MVKVHHCPMAGRGGCRHRFKGKFAHCKIHQTLCQNPKCASKKHFLKVTDHCKECGYKHPDHKYRKAKEFAAKKK
ncbi:hypothetical protein EAF04_003586 [Stromatinia cepivora]|nr:hypothetical protein EAF04_003586 [Stromatinia cepivora]